MAKLSLVALVSLAICLSFLLSLVAATKGAARGAAKNATKNVFIVEGKVYCDTCRVEFETPLSQPIKGAVVNLECRNRTDGKSISHSADVSTNDSGAYKIEVKGDHSDEICEVTLVKSPRRDCSEPTEVWRKSRVVLTKKDGVKGAYRFANNLGFMQKEALAECEQVLADMGYYDVVEENEGHSNAA